MGDLPADFHIIVRWDEDESRPVYDLADVDPWTAVTLLRQVAAEIWDRLPGPRETNDPPDEDDE